MTKRAKTTGGRVTRQGRRVVPALRKRVRAAKKAATVAAKPGLTLGDLIAAAFDAVGGEVKDVARVLSSPDLAIAIHKRIVVV